MKIDINQVIKKAFGDPKKEKDGESDNYLLYGMPPNRFLDSDMNPMK